MNDAQSTRSDEEIDRILNRDPVDEAEKIVDQFGGGWQARGNLSLLLALGANADKRKLMEELGDTGFNNTLVNYQAIIESIGFEKVLEIEFEMNPDWLDDQDPNLREKFFVYARRDGLLLKFDTYGFDSVNSSSLYYNWVPANLEKPYRYTSSGGFVRDEYDAGRYVWSGNHDGREALKHNISKLERNGKFLSTWKERPFLWLLHYRDDDVPGYDYKAINAERIAMLPEWVQKMMGPNND